MIDLYAIEYGHSSIDEHLYSQTSQNYFYITTLTTLALGWLRWDKSALIRVFLQDLAISKSG